MVAEAIGVVPLADFEHPFLSMVTVNTYEQHYYGKNGGVITL